MNKKSVLIYFFIIILNSSTLPIENRRQENGNDDNGEDLYPDDDDDENQCGKLENFVGTNLFQTESMCADVCLSSENVGLLTARKEFENLLPKSLPKTLMDDELVMSLMQYFYGAKQVIIRMSTGKPKDLSEKAFYDTLGGYLQWYVIPVVKNSFYAGLVCLKTAKNVMEVFRQCKIFLNTNGNGWKAPINDFGDFEISIQPILLMEEVDDTSCLHLEMSDDKENDEEMLVPLPKLDREEKGMLSNIWLPFKRKKSFNLRSYHSAFIFLKYFEMVSKCYKYENLCQDNFNTKLREWVEENIEIHLEDEIFYPGLGAILRVQETLRQKVKPRKKVSKKDLREEGQDSDFDIDLIHAAQNPQNQDPGKKDFLNELFGKYASKDVARCGDYEDDEYVDETSKEKGPDRRDNHRGRYLMALWISLAFLLFFCICCIPLMIIWHRKDRYLFNEDGSPRGILCFKGKDQGNGSPPPPKRSSKNDKSKKKEDEKHREEYEKQEKMKKQKEKEKKEKQEKEKQEKQEREKKEKQEREKQEKEKAKPPPPAKKNTLGYSSGTDVNSSQSLSSPTKTSFIPTPFNKAVRVRNATEPNWKPPENKKFSISRKGKIPNNDPVAQRLALARGDQKDNPVPVRNYSTREERRARLVDHSSGWETTDFT